MVDRVFLRFARAGEAPKIQDARDDFREAVDAHPRLV